MIVALLWLTISTPFVYAHQQETKKEAAQKHQGTEKTDDSSNPLSNTNEEKSEGGVTTLSEYLLDVQQIEHHFITLSLTYKCHSSDLYLAFHPETISPPPDRA